MPGAYDMHAMHMRANIVHAHIQVYLLVSTGFSLSAVEKRRAKLHNQCQRYGREPLEGASRNELSKATQTIHSVLGRARYTDISSLDKGYPDN